MRIAIIGTGYVGLVTGTCFSETGLTVTCIDIDEGKIRKLQNGIVPIYEPGLDRMLKKNLAKNRLFFTTSLKEGIEGAEAIFIAVGTPPGEDGSADLQYVLSVARDIGKHLNDYAVIVTKSTVPIGTSEKVRNAIKEELDKRGVDIEFDVASNPEFLKEGDAINDFMKPDRIVIGVENEKAKKIMKKLYHPFVLNGHPILFMDIPSAEMTKYAANSMLATRISFMNDLSVLCEKVGADINLVRKGIGSDPRIGPKFLYAGTGYGGSCFPKDVKALIKTSDEYNHSLEILKAVEKVNERQKGVLIEKIIFHFGSEDVIKGKTFAVWGLSFKPNTDDMREAPSIVVINRLLQLGAKIKAYDPVAMNEAKKIFDEEKVYFAKDQYDAAEGADALLIVTEWNEFRLPNFERLKKIMNEHIIFDGRNIFELEMLKGKGFVYHSIGRKIIFG